MKCKKQSRKIFKFRALRELKKFKNKILFQTNLFKKFFQIDHERTIEYIPVVVGGSNDEGPIDSEKLILIIVVAILFVVILIAGVTLFKVRKIRQIPSGLPTTSVGVVNKGIDA